MGWPTTSVMRAAVEGPFSCIYKSARKQVVKSALIINIASGRVADKNGWSSVS
jgi:hypothetical protein